GHGEAGSGGTSHDVGIRLQVGSHHDGVDDVSRLQISAGGQHGFADLYRALAHCLFLDDDSALTLDRRGDTRRHRERGIGRIHQCVDLAVGDVTTLAGARSLAGLRLPPLPSCASTASHERSSSACDTLPRALPCADRSASIPVNRRRNFSIAPCSASSASIDARRATLTIENNTSPSSSWSRSLSSASSAAAASRHSSSTLFHAA